MAPIGARELLDGVRVRRHTLPTLSSVALEVWKLTRDQKYDFGAVAGLLRREQRLAGRVLGLAQSPRFHCPIPPTSIEDAVRRLGGSTIGDLVLETAVTMSVLHAPGFEAVVDEVRHHTLVVSQLSVEVARARGSDVGHAFIVGLLHGVGAVYLLLVAGDEARASQRPLPRLGDLRTDLSRGNATAGAFLAEHWGLPLPVVRAIGAQDTEDLSDLGATLRVAKYLAQHHARCPNPIALPTLRVPLEQDVGQLSVRARIRLVEMARGLRCGEQPERKVS